MIPLASKSITSRWITGSLGVIVIILILVELAFAFTLRIFFYNSVRQSLMSQANTVSTLMSRYAEDPSVDYRREVRNLIENFEARDRMELMALDVSGAVVSTSSGFEVGGTLPMPDFQYALSSPDGVGSHQGVIADENVMAVTMLSPAADETIAATRLIVSLTRVDASITTVITVALLFGVAIVFFMLLSGSYFISSIVIPVGEIGKTAKRIAQGDFETRLAKENEDEIGELCETINNMAEELATADRLKNEFISSVSHELRTPLTAIKGWSETILDARDGETTEKGMRIIISETDRLTLMVEELLDFSRMQSGQFKMTIERIDLLAELEEAVLMYTEKARRDQIELTYDEYIESAAVMADKNRLRQVFINIIDNAIKYSDPHGSVQVTVEGQGDWIVVNVQDSGCGIPPEDLSKIKRKFYKANMSRRGSGIGLAVADEIVAAMLGTLDITSALGEGTCVTICIPTARQYEQLTRQPDGNVTPKAGGNNS